MILDGKVVAAARKQELRKLLEEFPKQLHLAVILVGNHPASRSYVSSKEKACHEVGIDSQVISLDENITTEELKEVIRSLNADEKVDGILVQLPLPNHINEQEILQAIDPSKDVDCFHPYNVGRLFLGQPIIQPCTPKGVMEMLSYYNISPAGKHAVVIGRSNIVGKPMAALLLQANATVTICHSRTPNLSEEVKRADIVIAAVGRPKMIGREMIKDGAVVIDVGINRIEDPSNPKGYTIVGDVDFESVSQIASAITPVPGGVGLMTVAELLWNTYTLARCRV
ncbi:bifunctional methylenetetrahydrofolate dehydrogenase/methenyltetrahydrofolate cyclohydrolase FolD [Thermospira aquatica]|uniref:Bifunctional protein FolD n=1 Tax=Thermospira aquatica TaxID=2828656 RepID=A0AAX3BEI6_9SPIR|nr:bifunctional methylenetetrahydrofolate dehydrogenase/methenyltetrahydrofolate cyclohydrolase FolD [Thermospira aquatica]URA10655.1 bifunctional methylenetetrahydrofolate dehydrogenase/methenyltetrahydrofolate cyclohydrolase FolD [Thermospira aquatica]